MSKSVRCTRCGQSFGTRKALSLHVRDRHPAYFYALRALPIVAVLAVSGLTIFLLGSGTVTPEQSTISVWEIDLPVVTRDGPSPETFPISGIRGRPSLVEFMVSWCPHCQKMAPVVEEIYQEYGDSVMFVSVAGAWRGATIDSTVEFLRTYGGSWRHVFDAKNTVFEYFDVDSTPTYLLFDSKGEITQRVEGEASKETLATVISGLR